MLKQKIIKIDNFLANLEKRIIIFCVITMILISSIQIFLRIFFHSGIIWIDTFLRHLVMISALFAASLVSYYSSHFKIEIIEKFDISNEIKKYLDMFSKIINLAAVFIILLATINFIKIEYDLKTIKLEPEIMNLFLVPIFFNMFFHTFTSFFKKEIK